MAVALLVGAAPLADARVFWVRPRSHGAVEAGQPGWALAYAAELLVNGGAGRMEVLGASAGPRETGAALERAYQDLGLRVYWLSTGGLMCGLAVDDARVIRLLILAPTPGHESLVFRFDQTREEFSASLQRPPVHQLEEIPLPPGGRPRFFAAHPDAGVRVEISDSPRRARDLIRFYSDGMAQDGWTALTPHDARGVAPQGGLYARGEQVAAVFIAEEETTGISRVTRLVQRVRFP